MAATQFTVNLVVAGTVDSFETTAYEASLRDYLECFDPTCSVVLTVSAASVLVQSVVTTTSDAPHKLALALNLTNASPTAIESTLGVVPEAAPVVGAAATVSVLRAVAPPSSPPSLSPSPPSLSLDPPSPPAAEELDGQAALSSDGDDDLSVGLGVGLGLALPILLICLLVCCWYHRREQRIRERKQLVIRTVVDSEATDYASAADDEESKYAPIVSTADVLLQARTAREHTPPLRTAPEEPTDARPPQAQQQQWVASQQGSNGAGGLASNGDSATGEDAKEPASEATPAEGDGHHHRRRHTRKPAEGEEGGPSEHAPAQPRKKRSTPRVKDPYAE